MEPGNPWGLPFNYLLLKLVTRKIVSGTLPLFGQRLNDPNETVTRIGSDIVMALGLSSPSASKSWPT